MGWDVVEIGLRHNLPVDDPFATAREVAKRMKQNIRLVYQNEYEYDVANNIVRDTDSYDLIELAKYEVNSSREYLQMIVSNYQANQILELAGIDKLRKAFFASEFADFILRKIEEPYELYEIEDDESGLDIRIFKENVDIDVYIWERWSKWERALHQLKSDREWLLNYRLQIYNRAKLFGCNEVIICSDQGPTESIYANMHYSSEDLKEYTRSLQYLKDCNWSVSKIEEWKKNAKHIMFSSLFQDQFVLSDEDWVEVIYDDFSDLVSP